MKPIKRFFKKLFISLLLIFSLLFSSVSPVYAATFTAGMAKRDAPGPFAGGVMMQGDYGVTDTHTDEITYSRGSAISGVYFLTSPPNFFN